MSTATYQKLKKELKKELFQELSEFIVRNTQDPEGAYDSAFVKRILKLAKIKSKPQKYNPKTFANLIS